MNRFLTHWLVTALALGAAAWILPGVMVTSLPALLVAALALGLINAVVKPVLVVLTLPITIVTLGLFYLVVNGTAFALAAMSARCCQVNEFGAICGRVDQRSGCCHRGPHCESSGSQQSMMDRPQPMTSHSKQILNNSVSMQEMLSVVG